ncbi:hypothetical protein [Paralysiella testudinis]|uniref:Uncharacterized protein n=1 Tax=Paralysiella testudinis TaxID=2809020 RepID=A0A892ZPY7_9NEIS|nr:hypothetical protein [Paralysiella testudinis]QRQ82879.1 hypothetical protein JQU52_05745 [Paralysiella testudinis]
MIYAITGAVGAGKTRNMQRLLNDHYGRMAPNPVVYVANADSNHEVGFICSNPRHLC